MTRLLLRFQSYFSLNKYILSREWAHLEETGRNPTEVLGDPLRPNYYLFEQINEK